MDLSLAYRQFGATLDAQKRAHPPRGWNWYPYQSMKNIPVVDRLLAVAGFTLEELIARGPVLDIGCADGDLTYFLESAGAQVDALDYPPTNFNGMQGIRALHSLLGSSAGLYEQDIDRRFSLPRDRYGACFALGLLYHLKNPFAFLETLAEHSDYCFLSTRVAARFPHVKNSVAESAAAYLVDTEECNGDNTNYWIFSDAGLRRILQRTGWEIRAWLHNAAMPDSDPVRSDRDQRAFCFLQSDRARLWRRVERLQGWHELEAPGFRWTEKRFTLRAETGGGLRVKVFIPEVLLHGRESVTLTARTASGALPPRTFTTPGPYEYRERVSAGEVVFETSAALTPDAQDQRERGLVVLAAEVR